MYLMRIVLAPREQVHVGEAWRSCLSKETRKGLSRTRVGEVSLVATDNVSEVRHNDGWVGWLVLLV